MGVKKEVIFQFWAEKWTVILPKCWGWASIRAWAVNRITTANDTKYEILSISKQLFI